jgi:hypothetical protein
VTKSKVQAGAVTEVFQVPVIGNNFNRGARSLQFRFLFFETADNCQQFLVVNFIIIFRH